ncbi:30S ribosome-binding factor RbfA [bacterium]|nr:30S ribosome-binding factor RbfA [bacterium]
MVKSLRMERLEEQFKRDLVEIILSKMRDSRVKNVTVMGVEISPEFDYAKVFVSIIGDKKTKKTVLKVLEKASGFLRSELSNLIEIRRMPKLRFVLDDTIEHSIKIDRILTDLGFPREENNDE